MGKQGKIFHDWARLVMPNSGQGEQFLGLEGLQAGLEAILAQGRKAKAPRKAAIQRLREMVIPPLRGWRRKATVRTDEKDDPARG